MPILNSLLEKRYCFVALLKALSTDTSCIKIGVCYHKLSTLEFNFHYRLSFFLVSRGGLTKAAGLELEVVLIHDFSIRAHSTGLHQY